MPGFCHTDLHLCKLAQDFTRFRKRQPGTKLDQYSADSITHALDNAKLCIKWILPAAHCLVIEIHPFVTQRP